MRNRSFLSFTTLVAVVLLATSCGGGSGSSNSSGAGSSSGGGRGGTLTLLANSNWGPADPAKNYTLQEWQLLIITYDGLVQFRSTGGAAGTELLPDLATEIPKPTNGGKTYAFTLRPGIKFSDGTPLKASDFVTVMTRQFTVPGPANGFYGGIVGADACLKNAASCDLTKGVVADDAAGTVTFNLTAPDPEFLYKLSLPFAFAVPGNTSLKDLGNNPPPGTGPYMWKSYDPQHEAVLVRNPSFKVWNADTQPDGMVDEIDYKFGLTVEAEVTQVENGQADWVFDPPPSDRLNELSTQYADQVHVNPLTAEYYFALNVNIPPFDNQKARQAINFAADRSAYVKIYGGPSLAVPTCQVLPPNFPGYKPYCPYTTNPGDGVWHGPDLAKAKQLVAESGTKGAKVSVVGTTDEVGKAIAQQMVNDLNAIGYKASAKLLAGGIQYGYIQNSDNNVQVGYSQWYQDYPAASDFLNVLFGCPGFHPHSDASPNISGFCDKTIQAEMDAALTLGETDPTAANEQWAKIDAEVTDQAPMVQLFNPKLIDFVSKRVKGYAWSPQWYMLFSHLSVK
ncbi:MAG: peptide/nickel transport system substrate-binding protein [Gaiellales bacterium]|nr:peptide/nickel transport system substrate-binding protein [Gaiellales bacterium]